MATSLAEIRAKLANQENRAQGGLCGDVAQRGGAVS